MIEEFILEIDKRWKTTAHEPIPLHIIGSAALLLQMDYSRGTKDADVLEIEELPENVSEQLKTLAGKDSQLAGRYHLYIDLVAAAIPFLPQSPLFHALDTLNDSIKSFRILTLDPLDVVISKLKTFRPGDLDDIRAVVDANLLDPKELVERFQSAKEQWLMDARSSALKQYIENLHTIQRDYLHVDETPIDLPGWIDS